MRRIALLCLLCFGLTVSAIAQGSTVTGRVLDPHGSVIPHATATLRNTLSGAGQTLYTSDNGTYAFTQVAAGAYSLILSAPGLATQTRQVHIASDKTASIPDITLPLASVQQSITVVSASRVQE